MYFYSAPTNVAAVQESVNSVLVTWGPSSDAAGYKISYNSSGGDSGNVTLDDSTTSHTLTGLQNGETYFISVEAISDTLPSVRVEAIVELSE